MTSCSNTAVRGALKYLDIFFSWFSSNIITLQRSDPYHAGVDFLSYEELGVCSTITELNTTVPRRFSPDWNMNRAIQESAQLAAKEFKTSLLSADLQVLNTRIYIGNTHILQSFPAIAIGVTGLIWGTSGSPGGPSMPKPAALSQCHPLCVHTIAPARFISHTKGQKLASRLPVFSDTQCTEKKNSKELLAVISHNLRLFIFKTFAANLPIWLSYSCWILSSEHSNLLEIKSNQLFYCLGFKYYSAF